MPIFHLIKTAVAAVAEDLGNLADAVYGIVNG
jgi:hypothetical protein